MQKRLDAMTYSYFTFRAKPEFQTLYFQTDKLRATKTVPARNEFTARTHKTFTGR